MVYLGVETETITKIYSIRLPKFNEGVILHAMFGAAFVLLFANVPIHHYLVQKNTLLDHPKKRRSFLVTQFLYLEDSGRYYMFVFLLA